MATPGRDDELLGGLDEIVKEAVKNAEAVAHDQHGSLVVAFFDLTGSTAAKLASGNAAAVREALTFTKLAAVLSARFGGSVVKSLGDGALATFDDAMGACRAALTLRYATHEILGLRMTAGLTVGRPLRVRLDGNGEDVLGDVVDKAARIQGLAAPGQVLVDGALRDQIRADVAGMADWVLDAEPRRTHAKGVGRLDLYELALPAHWRPKRALATPFALDASGRPSIDEKLALIRDAQSEIIEIGTGLTSFAQYFEGQKPNEFRDPIRALVRGGVTLKCFALDPEYEAGVAWLAEQGDTSYRQAAELARERLEREAKHGRANDYLGRLSYHRYRRVPEFWCLGVDVDDPVDGRMFFQPYLMGVARSATPVVQVSRTSNGELYEKYLTSVRAVRAASDERRR